MIDVLAWAELVKNVFKLFNPKNIFKKIVFGWNYYFRSPYNVLIYGCSGAGKTEFLRSLMEKPITEVPMPRTQIVDKNNKIVFANGRKIRFYDLPGHTVHKTTRHKELEKINKRRIRCIINVVTYGYNDADQNDLNNIFDNDTLKVKENYLNTNRKAELQQVEEWKDFIHNDCGIESVITVVTKADLWYENYDDVLCYYREGEYDKCIRELERVCHISIYPYCSIINGFGGNPVKLSFTERNKQKLHRDLKEALLEIIRYGSK